MWAEIQNDWQNKALHSDAASREPESRCSLTEMSIAEDDMNIPA